MDIDSPEVPLTEEAVANIIAHVAEPVLLAHHLPGLDEPKVRIMENDNRHDHIRLAQTIANAWFHNKKERPTWEKLIGALKEQAVAEATLAQDVEHLRRGSTTSPGSSFSISLTSRNGSELTKSGNGGSALIHAAQLERLEIAQTADDLNLIQIKRSFTLMMYKIADELTRLKVSVNDVRKHLSNLIDNRTRFLNNTSRCRKMRDFFALITDKCRKIPLLSYDNHHYVKQVIKMVAIDEANRENILKIIQTYIKQLNGYKVAKKLASMLPYYIDRQIDESESERRPIRDDSFCNDLMTRLKCKVKFTPESLDYIDELWIDIQEQFDIPSLTAFLYSLVPGSLKITWLIQPSWACCILRNILLSVSFFREHSIVKVALDNVSIYDEDNEECIVLSTLSSLWLKQASLSGRIEKFQEVLDQPEIDINTTLSKDNATPLLIASYHGHDELVSFLLEHGANSSATLTNGQTALHLAAIEGFPDVVGILHSDNNELVGVYDQRGYSPLMEAVARNHCEVVQVLVNVQLDDSQLPTLDEAFLLAITKGHVEVVKILHRCGANTSRVTEDEKTALEIVSAAGNAQIVDYLLAAGNEMDLEMSQEPLNTEEKTAALFMAIENEHLEIVKIFLKSQFKPFIIDSMDDNGLTPLMKAVCKRLPELVSIIAEAGAELDLTNNDCKTALMLAAESGQRLIAEILLKKDAEINLQQETTGKTALHLASENGHLDVVEEFLKPEYKANITIKDLNGARAQDIAKLPEVEALLKRSLSTSQKFLETIKRPFRWMAKASLNSKLISACKIGNLDQVRDCIKNGADPNYKDTIKWTGLMWASNRGHDEVVKFLLENDTKRADPNVKTLGSWTALLLASRNGHYKVVERLVNNGADVLTQTWQGWTALLWAAYCSGKKNKTEEVLQNRVKIAEVLIAKDSRIIDIPDNDKFTPLMQASIDGNPGLVELLIQKGANKELLTRNHWTALLFATKHDRREVVRALVKGGAKVDHQKKDKTSAFHIAIAKGNTECLEIMTEPQPGAAQRVNLDVKDKWGMTPLMLATKRGNKKATEILVNAGASVNVKSEEFAGWSALFFAIKEGYVEIAKFLLLNKANIRDKDENKQTPLGYAFSQQKAIYTKLIDFLQEKPQVLKAISSPPAEASSDAPVEVVTTYTLSDVAASSVEEKASHVQPEKGTSEREDAPVLHVLSSTPIHGETESTTATNNPMLKKLMEEAETSVGSKIRVSSSEIRRLDRMYQRYMAASIQSSGRGAAGAA